MTDELVKYLPGDGALAAAAITTVHVGNTVALGRLLSEHPELATIRIGSVGDSRTLLHVATDWPGHFPNVAESIAILAAAGADVDASFDGGHRETPLHWAASSDDVAALDALLNAGANIEAPGAVLGGGAPLADACGFGPDYLIERGGQLNWIGWGDQTCLDLALANADAQFATWLRERGAQPARNVGNS